MPMLHIGQRAPDFRELPGVDGGRHSLASFAAKPVLVLIFTGNGCPTAKANEERLVTLQAAYEPRGVQLVAINSNNASLSPSDTLAEMAERAHAKRFTFPYLKDEDGSVARAFGAENTPHVFVLDRARRLRYKGRIDDARDPVRATRSDLEAALAEVIAHRAVQVPETQPFGCAIVR
jgi:peroxiredoxin